MKGTILSCGTKERNTRVSSRKRGNQALRKKKDKRSWKKVVVILLVLLAAALAQVMVNQVVAAVHQTHVTVTRTVMTKTVKDLIKNIKTRDE